jgi:hypothetical protein
MRIFVENDRRFLAAAKHLSRQIPELKLSRVQEALSKALGYRDFHDFQSEHKSEVATPLDHEISEDEFRRRWVKIVVEAAGVLDADDGTIQYHLSKTQLAGNRQWTLDDHLSIRAECWLAQGFVGLRGRQYGGFGRIKEQDTQFGEDGYIINSGKPSAILGPNGFWNCEDDELEPLNSAIRPFVPHSHYVPYGYKLDGDRKIYFGRQYYPLWSVHSDGKIERPNPWDRFHADSDCIWFAKITGEHFVSDKTRTLALNSLAEDGVFGLPVFANATPSILKSGTTSLSAAVDVLESHHYHGKSWMPTLAKYAKRNQSAEGDNEMSVIVAENDWERLLDECKVEHGSSSDPCRYFELGAVHYFREASR